MDVQKLTHEVRIQQWRKIVTDCRNSGKTIKAWCTENNINIKTYYHWQKTVCQQTCRELAIHQNQLPVAIPAVKTPAFVELRNPSNHAGQLAVTIQHNHTEIHIYRSADAELVETAIAAMKHLC